MNNPASASSGTGPFAVCTHTFEARDPGRDRLFPCDIWCPDEPGAWPLVLRGRNKQISTTALAYHYSESNRTIHLVSFC